MKILALCFGQLPRNIFRLTKRPQSHPNDPVKAVNLYLILPVRQMRTLRKPTAVAARFNLNRNRSIFTYEVCHRLLYNRIVLAWKIGFSYIAIIILGRTVSLLATKVPKSHSLSRPEVFATPLETRKCQYLQQIQKLAHPCLKQSSPTHILLSLHFREVIIVSKQSKKDKWWSIN